MGVSSSVGACACGAVCASMGKDDVRAINCALTEPEKDARGKVGLAGDCVMLGSAKPPEPNDESAKVDDARARDGGGEKVRGGGAKPCCERRS